MRVKGRSRVKEGQMQSIPKVALSLSQREKKSNNRSMCNDHGTEEVVTIGLLRGVRKDFEKDWVLKGMKK